MSKTIQSISEAQVDACVARLIHNLVNIKDVTGKFSLCLVEAEEGKGAHALETSSARLI